jgi:hypothetical protein
MSRWGQKVKPPEGKVRASQMIGAYGPGAMIDLLGHAVLVGGLDFWRFGDGAKIVDEPRLRERLVVRNALGNPLSRERPFREPPVGDDRAPDRRNGIKVLRFPQWFVCQRCRALVHATAPALQHKDDKLLHDCDKSAPACVPVRFVAACPRGHLQDFYWASFVHKGETCGNARLTLSEGVSGDLAHVIVRCLMCNARRPLSHAKIEDANFPCNGKRPWLGPAADEPGCGLHLRLLMRTASNSYFAQVESALSIPESKDPLAALVRDHWDAFEDANREDLPTLRKNKKLKEALASLTDDAVLQAIARARAGTPQADGLRTAEFKTFLRQPRQAPGDLPPQDKDFFARQAPLKAQPDGIARVVLAHKLREVRVQVGFTRFESPTPNEQGEYDLGVTWAPLGMSTDWLPACEIRGEGVFLQLDEARVRAWEDRPAVQARAQELLDGFKAWLDRNLNPTSDRPRPEFPGVRFYLLHSLSHLLMTAMSLECGYPTSAIRERIYCSRDEAFPMAGLLLSTGSPGAEGTLGGLVDQGRAIDEHLRRALDMGRLCSNDPLCAAHSARGDLTDRQLEGSACYGCLYVAEPSCERFNRYLDRALVVPTLGSEATLAFFGAPG